jgi:hypothetical protein
MRYSHSFKSPEQIHVVMKLTKLVEDASLLLQNPIAQVTIDARVLRRVQQEESTISKKACMENLISDIQVKTNTVVKKLRSGGIHLTRKTWRDVE